MIWLLDTNVLIHMARGRPAVVRRRIRSVSPQDVVITSVTIAELWYGAAKTSDPEARSPLKNGPRAASGLLAPSLRCEILNKSPNFASGFAPCPAAKILAFAITTVF